MIKSHHELVTKWALEYAPPHNLPWSDEEIIEEVGSPDVSEDMEIDLFLGNISASSFLHFTQGYCLKDDYSYLQAAGDHPILRVGENAKVTINNDKLLALMEIFNPGRIEDRQIRLRHVRFPHASRAVEVFGKTRKGFIFDLHTCQDSMVAHHELGFLGLDHQDFEEGLWTSVKPLEDETYISFLDVWGVFESRAKEMNMDVLPRVIKAALKRLWVTQQAVMKSVHLINRWSHQWAK